VCSVEDELIWPVEVARAAMTALRPFQESVMRPQSVDFFEQKFVRHNIELYAAFTIPFLVMASDPSSIVPGPWVVSILECLGDRALFAIAGK